MLNEWRLFGKSGESRPLQFIGFRSRKSEAESHDRKSANVPQKANVAVFLPALAAAKIENSKPADGEVVANRIGRIELRQAVGDLTRALPIGTLAFVETEESRDAMDVSVERNDELRRIDEIPDAEVG